MRREHERSGQVDDVSGVRHDDGRSVEHKRANERKREQRVGILAWSVFHAVNGSEGGPDPEIVLSASDNRSQIDRRADGTALSADEYAG
jgi:hypothetical protein